MAVIPTLFILFAINPDVSAFTKWQAMLDQREYIIIQQVHYYYNAVPYVTDYTDEWKHPSAFLLEGGDCEDYAIAKYFALKGHGIESSIWVGWNVRGVVHAITVTDKWVLDNEQKHPIPREAYAGFQKAYEISERGWKR